MPVLPNAGTASVPVLPTSEPSWSGQWESVEFGTLILTQLGDNVTGTYPWRDGKITGTVSGNTLKGRWEEVSDNAKGEFVFVLGEDGRSFNTFRRYEGDVGWKTNPKDGSRR